MLWQFTGFFALHLKLSVKIYSVSTFVCLSVCRSVCLSVGLSTVSIGLSVCQSVWLSVLVGLSVYLSVGRFVRLSFAIAQIILSLPCSS